MAGRLYGRRGSGGGAMVPDAVRSHLLAAANATREGCLVRGMGNFCDSGLGRWMGNWAVVTWASALQVSQSGDPRQKLPNYHSKKKLPNYIPQLPLETKNSLNYYGHSLNYKTSFFYLFKLFVFTTWLVLMSSFNSGFVEVVPED